MVKTFEAIAKKIRLRVARSIYALLEPATERIALPLTAPQQNCFPQCMTCCTHQGGAKVHAAIEKRLARLEQSTQQDQHRVTYIESVFLCLLNLV